MEHKLFLLSLLARVEHIIRAGGYSFNFSPCKGVTARPRLV
jgi:hypothetical protein